MTNEEMLKVLDDLKYQFNDRIEETKYSKDEDLLEALESNKMASEALDMAIKKLGQEEKTAYWLPCVERDGKTVEWVCSSCRRIKSVTSDRTEYCPVCGAKMIE